MLIITFRKKDHIYNIWGDELKINLSGDGDNTVQIKGLRVFEDDSEPVSFGKTFRTENVGREEVADEVIRAYLNDNSDLKTSYVCKELREIYNKFFKDSFVNVYYNECYMRKVNKQFLGEYGILELQMVDKDQICYYTDGSEYVMVRADGSLASDYEFFYENSFAESMEQGDFKYILPIYMEETNN